MTSRLLLTSLVTALAIGGAVAQEGAEDDTYRIGIEDVLSVVVYESPDVSVDVQVRPDGRITLPLLRDIPAAGRTPERLAEDIEKALVEFKKSPNVTVIVKEIKGYPVFFLGEVARQGELIFKRPMRLLQAIAAAGGLTQFAKKEITLLRETPEGEERIRIDYRKLLQGDESQPNLYLRPGDTLLFE